MRIIILAGVVVALTAGVLSPLSASPAAAANAADFDPGYIISDQVFYNSSTMSASDIQSFLQQREPRCSAGYTCLKDYRQDFGARGARVEGCAAIPGSPNISAAQIISIVATACGINPQALLVLLEKEQGLVSSTAPSSARYQAATGYACPDTAPCDALYYGFGNQVYSAALQFRIYRYHPANWNYVAGRTNSIFWSPNRACGSSQVYIQNQATAGLYIYTPYRPNAAALANLYGTGDACSSYGNRNFWRTFSDWFGSPTSPLVRSADSLQIWLISGGKKYPINNPDIYYALSPLGSLASTTSSYLASLPTGSEVSRFIGDPSGNLYFLDAGRRFHFDSCERVVDFGFTCANQPWTPLSDAMMTRLTDAGNLTNAVQDASGHFFRVSDGTRQQALDQPALAAAGETEAITHLSDTGLQNLPIEAPLLRPDTVIQQEGASAYWLSDGSISPLPADLYSQSALQRLDLRSLLPASVSKMTVGSSPATGVLSNGGNRYLVTATGLSRLGAAVDVRQVATPVGAGMLSRIPVSEGSIIDPWFERPAGSLKVYVVSSGVRRWITTADEYQQLAATASTSTIYDVPQRTSDSLFDAGDYVPAGVIVRGSGPEAYLMDGTSRLIYIDSYDTTSALGLGSSANVVSAQTLTSTTRVSSPLQPYVTCDGVGYLGLQGVLHRIDSTTAMQYGYAQPTSLDAATCARLNVTGTPMSRWVRDETGTVWMLVDGKRRYVPSYQLLAQLGGSASSIQTVSAAALARYPIGAAVISTDLSRQPVFIRSANSPEVDIVNVDGTRSWILTWDDYAAVSAGSSDPSIYVLPPSVVQAIPATHVLVRPGTAVRSVDGPVVSLVDGPTPRLVYVDSLEVTQALGIPAVQVVPAEGLRGIPSATGTLQPAVQCAGTTYLGLGGRLYVVTGDAGAAFGTLASTGLDAATCAALPKAATPLQRFLRAPDGSVYYVDDGEKQHILSPARLAQMGGSASTIIDVSNASLDRLATGPAIS